MKVRMLLCGCKMFKLFRVYRRQPRIASVGSSKYMLNYILLAPIGVIIVVVLSLPLHSVLSAFESLLHRRIHCVVVSSMAMSRHVFAFFPDLHVYSMCALACARPALQYFGSARVIPISWGVRVWRNLYLTLRVDWHRSSWPPGTFVFAFTPYLMPLACGRCISMDAGIAKSCGFAA